jgi:hypothetical protein
LHRSRQRKLDAIELQVLYAVTLEKENPGVSVKAGGGDPKRRTRRQALGEQN